MDIAAFKEKLRGITEQSKANMQQLAVTSGSALRMDREEEMYQSAKRSGLVDPNPIQKTPERTTAPDDSSLTIMAKNAFNAVAPESMKIPTNFGGLVHSSSHTGKDYNYDNGADLAKRIANEKDDPNAVDTLYYYKERNGYDTKTGEDKWAYKVDVAAHGVMDRTFMEKDPANIRILKETRTNNARDLEARFHGNRDFLQYRTSHDDDKSLSPSGNSEYYNKDLLGLDTGKMADYKRNEKIASDYSIAQQDVSRNSGLSNYASAVGSGALNVVGKTAKLIGEADPTTAFGTKDNNIMTRFGQHLIDNADKITNYNNHDEVMAIHGLQKGIKSGNPLAIADAFITGGPELFLKSLPEMATLVGTGGAGAGMLALNVGMNANDQMDNRMKANGGKNLSMKEKLGVTAAQVISTMTDSGAARFGLNMDVMGKPVLSMISANTGKAMSVEAILAKAEPTVARALLKAASTSVMKTGATVGAEGGQEALQEAIAVLQEQYGIDKNQGKSAVDLLKENKQRILDAGAGGALAGGMTGGYHGATAGTSEAASGIADANRNTALRNASVSGSVGDAAFNAERHGTIRDDAIVKHGELGALNDSIVQAGQSSQSPAEAIDNIRSVVGNNEHTSASVAQMHGELISGVMATMAPESVVKIAEVVQSNPELQQAYAAAQEQVMQNPQAASATPDVIHAQTVNTMLNSIPMVQAESILNAVDPTSTQSIIGKANVQSITDAISQSVTNQQEQVGTIMSEADRQSKFYQQNAPTIESAEAGIADLSQKSARWGRKATKNVANTLSRMSDEALTEAANDPSAISQASKKTRGLWATLKGEEKTGGLIDPAHMADLIAKEQNARAAKVKANEIKLHQDGASIQSSKELKVINDALKVAIATKGTDIAAGNKIISMDQNIKDLYKYTKEFINRGVHSEAEHDAINDIINQIETNVGMMKPTLVKYLRDQLKSAKVKDKPSVITPNQTSIPSNLEASETKSKKVVTDVIDKGSLKTKQAIAGKLREGFYTNLKDVGIVRTAIAEALKNGEINQSLANSMNKKLDSIEATTKEYIKGDDTIPMTAEEVEAAEKAGVNIAGTVNILKEYDPSITPAQVADVIKASTPEALDKIVKIICG